MKPGVLIPGLDATTPLGFLAALGVLRILDERARESGGTPPRLAFREVGRWRPVFNGVESLDSIIACVKADTDAWSKSPVLGFRYVKLNKAGPIRFGGLTPPLRVLRGWMLDRLRAQDQSAIEYVCALIAETATQTVDEDDMASVEQLGAESIYVDLTAANDRACLQTPFDFSNRNIQFLDQIDHIRESIVASPRWIESELACDQSVPEAVRIMGWDTSANVPGAQYPGRSGACRPTTEWLAFRGLVFLPLFGRGKNARATSCRGRRLKGEFVWPIWVPYATASATRSLLAYPKIESAKQTELRALGVAQIFRTRFSKLGKYVAIFTPTEPVGGAVLPSPGDVRLPALATVSRGEQSACATSREVFPKDSAQAASLPRQISAAQPGKVDWGYSDDDTE